MKKAIPIVIAVAASISVVLGLTTYQPEPESPVTQQDLREMIDQWMSDPQEDDMQQRLEIMMAFYIFEESGQKLSDDQAGRVMLNQIRKMISFDIPKTELDQIKQEIRDELRQQGFEIKE